MDYGVGPSLVVKEVARAVARASDNENGSTCSRLNIIRNLRGSDLQALGKLDSDGGDGIRLVLDLRRS